MKTYIKLTAISSEADPKVTHLRVDLTYNKGGMNVWTYKQEPRGYYMTIVPVFRDGIMEGFTAFSGKKYLMKSVTRASAKQEQEAWNGVRAFIGDDLRGVVRNMGYELGEECDG